MIPVIEQQIQIEHP